MANGYARYSGFGSGGGTGGGVTSLNGLTGGLTIVAGSGITVTPAGSNITIASTSSGGSVTSVSGVNTNGFNLSITNPTTTPAITISTSVSGILKGASGALATALAGTDYSLGTAGLITGIVKSTTTTGTFSIAVAGTDFQAPGNYLTALTGDGTASGPGSAALTLATVNGNVGSFGSSTAIPNFTVNAKGLLTAAGTSVVIAPAGTLSGTTLNATVVTSSLTTVGTIGTGVWQGTAVTPAFGGTGLTTLTPYAVLAGGTTSTGTLQQVSGLGSSGNVLTSNGAGALPTWQPATGGFTNPMTTLGDIIYENATPAAARLAGNTTSVKQFLSQTGTGTISAAPAWAALASADIPNNAANTSGTAAGLSVTLVPASGGTGLATLTPYAVLAGGTTGTGTLQQVSGVGTTGQVLTSNGPSALPTWQAAGSSSGNYSAGFFGQNCSWSTSSSSFVTPTFTGSAGFTILTSSGLTVTAAASNAPGITFTPASSSAVFDVYMEVAVRPSSTSGSFVALEIWDGTNVIATANVATNTANSQLALVVPLKGIYAPGTTSAVTLSIRMSSSSGTASLIPLVTGVNSLEFTVVQLANGGAGGSGTVTSVAMTVPSDLSVSGSPITTSGTLAITRNSQSANLVMASPNGSSGTPSYRSLVQADLPAIVESIGVTLDGAGAVISTGTKGYIHVEYACTINGNTILADQSGSIVLDIKRSTYAGFPTTSSIVASAPPTLSSAQKSQDNTLTGWTTTLAAGDVLEFSVTSAATVTRINFNLKVTRT